MISLKILASPNIETRFQTENSDLHALLLHFSQEEAQQIQGVVDAIVANLIDINSPGFRLDDIDHPPIQILAGNIPIDRKVKIVLAIAELLEKRINQENQQRNSPLVLPGRIKKNGTEAQAYTDEEIRAANHSWWRNIIAGKSATVLINNLASAILFGLVSSVIDSASNMPPPAREVVPLGEWVPPMQEGGEVFQLVTLGPVDAFSDISGELIQIGNAFSGFTITSQLLASVFTAVVMNAAGALADLAKSEMYQAAKQTMGLDPRSNALRPPKLPQTTAQADPGALNIFVDRKTGAQAADLITRQESHGTTPMVLLTDEYTGPDQGTQKFVELNPKILIPFNKTNNAKVVAQIRKEIERLAEKYSIPKTKITDEVIQQTLEALRPEVFFELQSLRSFAPTTDQTQLQDVIIWTSQIERVIEEALIVQCFEEHKDKTLKDCFDLVLTFLSTNFNYTQIACQIYDQELNGERIVAGIGLKPQSKSPKHNEKLFKNGSYSQHEENQRALQNAETWGTGFKLQEMKDGNELFERIPDIPEDQPFTGFLGLNGVIQRKLDSLDIYREMMRRATIQDVPNHFDMAYGPHGTGKSSLQKTATLEYLDTMQIPRPAIYKQSQSQEWRIFPATSGEWFKSFASTATKFLLVAFLLESLLPTAFIIYMVTIVAKYLSYLHSLMTQIYVNYETSDENPASPFLRDCIRTLSQTTEDCIRLQSDISRFDGNPDRATDEFNQTAAIYSIFTIALIATAVLPWLATYLDITTNPDYETIIHPWVLVHPENRPYNTEPQPKNLERDFSRERLLESTGGYNHIQEADTLSAEDTAELAALNSLNNPFAGSIVAATSNYIDNIPAEFLQLLRHADKINGVHTIRGIRGKKLALTILKREIKRWGNEKIWSNHAILALLACIYNPDKTAENVFLTRDMLRSVIPGSTANARDEGVVSKENVLNAFNAWVNKINNDQKRGQEVAAEIQEMLTVVHQKGVEAVALKVDENFKSLNTVRMHTTV